MAGESREVWAKRVARWRDSELTAKEFAREIGVNAQTLSYWAWRLGAAARATATKPAAMRPRATQTPQAAQAAWIELDQHQDSK